VPVEVEIPVAVRASGSPAIRSVCARAHLGEWLDGIAVEPSSECVAEMTAFALAEGLVSATTAFIALDEDEIRGPAPLVRALVPAAEPADPAGEDR
jgi:hypothetical protein